MLDVMAVRKIAYEGSISDLAVRQILRYSAAPRAAMRFNGVVILWLAMAGVAAILFLA